MIKRFGLILVSCVYILCCNDIEVPSADNNNPYVKKVISFEALDKLDKSQLNLLRNEIFARHGYIFKDKELQKHFSSKEWYTPDSNFSSSKLNHNERKSIELIKEYEEKLKEFENKYTGFWDSLFPAASGYIAPILIYPDGTFFYNSNEETDNKSIFGYYGEWKLTGKSLLFKKLKIFYWKKRLSKNDRYMWKVEGNDILYKNLFSDYQIVSNHIDYHPLEIKESKGKEIISPTKVPMYSRIYYKFGNYPFHRNDVVRKYSKIYKNIINETKNQTGNKVYTLESDFYKVEPYKFD